MLRAICFDLDGTLIGFRANYQELLARMLERLGVRERQAEFIAEYDRAIRLEGAMTFRRAVEMALGQVGLAIPSDMDDFAVEAVSLYAAGIELLPGAIELLEFFPQPKAIITNGPSDMQWAAIRKVGIERYFKAIVVSGDPEVAVRKPNPRIFAIACRRLGVSPAEALMIGDHLEADVQGAIAFGMQGIYLGKDSP